jgi:phosphate starvation-inducible PhoH-like protein
MQMKMFLTRMGSGSKIVITGDVTQIDLPLDESSGLVHTLDVLKGVKGIGRVFLAKGDIVRHRLVQKIVSAYERADSRANSVKDR